MINPHIDRAISLIELHQNYVDLYEDIIFSPGKENNLKVVFSEDESEFNQNLLSVEDFNDDYLAHCRKDFHRHKTDLQGAKMRLREVMQKYNQGWIF
jgi:hypothetical protein